MVLPARWLPFGSKGIVMVETRVVGIQGELLYVPWVQHRACGAWNPVDYAHLCLYCQAELPHGADPL